MNGQLHDRTFVFGQICPALLLEDLVPRFQDLLERHSPGALAAAVEKGLGIRAHTRDAIAQFLVPPEPWQETTFRLDGRPHLRHVKVASCDVRAYQTLLGAGGAA